MTLGVAAILLLLTSADTTCGVAGAEGALLEELNASRRAAGAEALAPHPVLCELARDEARSVAARGGTPTRAGHINSLTERLYRSGYAPHSWTEGSLIGVSEQAILEQWRRVRPEWVLAAETGDFEHVGIGLGRAGGRLVVSMVLALKIRTVELRQTEPLRDLGWVRAQALAEVNRQRGLAGREEVVAQPLLDAAAQRHAEDMVRRSYYDHRSPEGATAKDRIRAAGYRGGRGLAENLAKGLFTPDEVVRRWMNSPGHRRNVLRRRSSETGFGVAFGVNRADELEVVWVQVFASR